MNNNLYVVTAVFNPERYKSRYDLYHKFEKFIKDSGAILYTIELAIGNQEFVVTQENNPQHIQLRTDSVLWYKENLLNILISRLPHNWEYVATIDADVTFMRPDWVKETIHELQNFKVIQMFTHAHDLDNDYEIMQTHIGFIFAFNNKLFVDKKMQKAHEGVKGYQHPGYAWAYRRETLNELGGLLDIGILGSSDSYMSFGLIGKSSLSLQKGLNINYKKAVFNWEKLAAKHVNGNIGYLRTHLIHYYHGKKKDRGYDTRTKILVDNNFDPTIHLKKDTSGLYKLVHNDTDLKNAIITYFKSRREDS